MRRIDGCIKNSYGFGLLKIKDCVFDVSLEEEILDFYSFDGDVLFEQNDIKISRGGIIRTKPFKTKEEVTQSSNTTYSIKGNTIYHSGNSANMIYIAGFYNLENDKLSRKQSLFVENNEIDCMEMTCPLDFRGLDSVVIFKNKIKTEQSLDNISINLSAIQKLQIRQNEIAAGRIMGYACYTPGGVKYDNQMIDGHWEIIENTINQTSENEAAVYIYDQNEMNLNLINNQFIFEKKGNQTVLSIPIGNQKEVEVRGNTIKAEKTNQILETQKSHIFWGTSKQHQRLIKNNKEI